MKKKKEEKVNELFALHLDGEMIDQYIWTDYSDKYGVFARNLYGWRVPKKVYYKIHHAKNGLRHLPKQIQKYVEIVRYLPSEVVVSKKESEE
jgi:hypothetical protein